MITYSLAAGGTSVAALFMAGYVPGIIWALCCMVVAVILAKKKGYKGTPGKFSWATLGKATLQALPSLSLIVVVIGGIVAGVFSATEGSAIAVVYSLILGICYRNITWKSFWNIVVESAKMSGMVVFLIGVSNILGWVMAFLQIPQAVSTVLLGITDNPIIILLIMNLILLIAGTFMDVTPAILIFTPLFLPIVQTFGMDPIHFGLVLVYNLCIGNITPPVGNTLFVAIKVGRSTLAKTMPYMLWYYVAILVGLLLVTYIPRGEHVLAAAGRAGVSLSLRKNKTRPTASGRARGGCHGCDGPFSFALFQAGEGCSPRKKGSKKRRPGSAAGFCCVILRVLGGDLFGSGHNGLLLPPAHAVGDGGDNRAHHPADKQGDEQGVRGAGAHGAALGTGEELQAVGDGHPDDNRGDDGDPHGGHGVARAPHHAGEDLGHAHGDVAHCQNPQHPHAGGDDLRGGGEHLHQVLAEQQDEGHQHHGDAQADFQAVLHALLHPVDAAGADVLAGVGGHGGAKGEVGHHGEAVHAHHKRCWPR